MSAEHAMDRLRAQITPNGHEPPSEPGAPDLPEHGEIATAPSRLKSGATFVLDDRESLIQYGVRPTRSCGPAKKRC